MTVKLRRRSKGKMISLYLEYYSKGKKDYEYLNLYLYPSSSKLSKLCRTSGKNTGRRDVGRDLRGGNSLLSTHFYYFGEEPPVIPKELKHIIKRGQKHLVFDDTKTIRALENWIGRFQKNKIYADPQLRFQFDPAWQDTNVKSNCG